MNLTVICKYKMNNDAIQTDVEFFVKCQKQNNKINRIKYYRRCYQRKRQELL